VSSGLSLLCNLPSSTPLPLPALSHPALRSHSVGALLKWSSGVLVTRVNRGR